MTPTTAKADSLMSANSMPESAEPRAPTAAGSAPSVPAPAPASTPASPASPLWLVGAYAVLVAWGVGTVVLFFTGVIGPR